MYSEDCEKKKKQKGKKKGKMELKRKNRLRVIVSEIIFDKTEIKGDAMEQSGIKETFTKEQTNKQGRTTWKKKLNSQRK